MDYARWYDNLSSHFRDDIAVHAINVLDRALVAIIAAVYIFAIGFMAFTGDMRVIRVIAVPALTFALVSVARLKIDAARPYELYDIDPIIVKDVSGRSFPSRHVASAVAIACAIAYIHLDWGVIAFAASAIVAFTRIVGGVHFPRDVAAGAVISIVLGLIGFVLIP